MADELRRVNKVKVDGAEREFPPGVEVLGGEDLYLVPFPLLSVADDVLEGEAGYKWSNPRRLGEGDDSAGKGFSKVEIAELFQDIKSEGLMNPLICRWVLHAGSLAVQVVDGERRFRCLDRQISTGEKVWSRTKRQFLPAAEVYSKVSCRIIVGDDRDALKIAFMVSDRCVSWGEGATAKLIRRLRGHGFTDQDILDVTKKTGQWLREEDTIGTLDDLTFQYYADGKINRMLALKFAAVKSLDRRHQHLRACYDDAVAHHQEEVKRADKHLERAEELEELAVAQLAEAQDAGDESEIQEAASRLETAQGKTDDRRRRRMDASRPKAGGKNLRNVAKEIAEENQEEVGEDVAQALRPGKIRRQLACIEELLENDGADETGTELASVNELRLLAACFKAVLVGEEDVLKVIRQVREEGGGVTD